MHYVKVFVALFALSFCPDGRAHAAKGARSVTADFLGTWKTVEQIGQTKFFGIAVIKKLRNGTIHAVNFKTNKKTRVAEVWLYPNGKTLNKNYVQGDGGGTTFLSGNWRVQGSAILRDYGELRTTLRRINKHKWIDTVREGKRGQVLVTFTLTRAGRH
jgi:hypothetical protein